MSPLYWTTSKEGILFGIVAEVFFVIKLSQ